MEDKINIEELKEVIKKEYTEDDKTICFETTPIYKIVILSLITFGIYEIILTIRYWQILKKNFGYKINVFLRGFLFINIFNFSLFPIMAKYTKSFNIRMINPYILATILFIFCMLANASFRITFRYPNLAQQLDSLLNFIDFITMFSFLIFAHIQTKINEVNKTYFQDAPVNNWSLANTLWAIPCSIIFLITLIGYFLPD